MSLLEVEDTGSGTPQGVVLAIIGPSLDLGPATKDTEVPKTARMYNLSSLINLARWTIGQKAGFKQVQTIVLIAHESPFSGHETTRPTQPD